METALADAMLVDVIGTIVICGLLMLASYKFGKLCGADDAYKEQDLEKLKTLHGDIWEKKEKGKII